MSDPGSLREYQQVPLKRLCCLGAGTMSAVSSIPGPNPHWPCGSCQYRVKFPTSFLVTLHSQAVSGSRARSPRHLPAARHWQLPSWICGCEEAIGWVLSLRSLRQAVLHAGRAGSGKPKSLQGELRPPSLKGLQAVGWELAQAQD